MAGVTKREKGVQDIINPKGGGKHRNYPYLIPVKLLVDNILTL